MDNIPKELICMMYGYMDPKSHLCFEMTCHFIFNCGDQQYYWKRHVLNKYPYMRWHEHTQDYEMYDYDFKKLWLDQNRKSKTLVIETRINKNKSDRAYTEKTLFDDYMWNMIIDPSGNPNVFMEEPHISIYLNCIPHPYKEIWSVCVNFTIRMNVIKNRYVRWFQEDHIFNQDNQNWGNHTLCQHTRLPQEVFIQIFITIK